MTMTREFVAEVRRRIAENPALSISSLAKELIAPEAYVIMALPVSMRMRVSEADLESIWEALATWQNTQVKSVLSLKKEFLPGGSRLEQTVVQCGGKGVLRPCKEKLGFIWFVSRPDGESKRRSVRFFDKSGGHIISVYLAAGEALAETLSYEEMRTRFGIIPKPPIRTCKGGCARCACKSGGRCCKEGGAGKGQNRSH